MKYEEPTTIHHPLFYTLHNLWAAADSISSFREKVGYDDNGNILLYLRHGNTIIGSPLAMDSLTYHYKKGSNQLVQVNDAVPSGNYPNDIDNEPSKYNYKYNTIGQLAHDSAGGIDSIYWTIYGKVWAIKKHNGDSIYFTYDPSGNRQEERFYPHSGYSDTTSYARDAQDMNIQCIFMESIFPQARHDEAQ